MREIKFRAWDLENDKYVSDRPMMYEPAYSISITGNVLVEAGYDSTEQAKNIQLEQYTGVKDGNGDLVYESDIIQKVWLAEMPDGSIQTTKIGDPFEVTVGNYVYGKWIAESILGRGFGVTNYVMPDELMIVGNIHENPELLEV